MSLVVCCVPDALPNSVKHGASLASTYFVSPVVFEENPKYEDAKNKLNIMQPSVGLWFGLHVQHMKQFCINGCFSNFVLVRYKNKNCNKITFYWEPAFKSALLFSSSAQVCLLRHVSPKWIETGSASLAVMPWCCFGTSSCRQHRQNRRQGKLRLRRLHHPRSGNGSNWEQQKHGGLVGNWWNMWNHPDSPTWVIGENHGFGAEVYFSEVSTRDFLSTTTKKHTFNCNRISRISSNLSGPRLPIGKSAMVKTSLILYQCCKQRTTIPICGSLDI